MDQSKFCKLIEDSDDEELPDLFDSSSEADNEKKDEISRGDIVWAQFRKLYWPSLVRFVYKKEKKVSVWYLDSPKKTFKVARNKIKTFSDPKVNTNIREEVESSPMKSKHTKVWLNALTYIRRQAEGHNDDPAAYFDLDQHYIASKDSKMHVTKSEQTDVEDALIIETNPEDSDEEDVDNSEDEENTGLEKKISIFWDLDDSNEDEAKTDAIVKCITSGKVDKHLMRIRSKKVPSKYQQTFDEAMKTDRKKLFGITACEVVKNLKKLKDISFHLMNLYEKTVEGGKCEMLDYVTSVWLPEAINQAVVLLDGGVSTEVIPDTKRKLFPPSEKIKEENSGEANQSKTDVEIKVENRNGCRRKLVPPSEKIKKENSGETNQSETDVEIKVENGSSCGRNLRKRPPRSVSFYNTSVDVSPVKSPRKKYKKR